MTEQIVHHNEQNKANGPGTASTTPTAPMVERAFRLLELLSLSEEGLTLSDMARTLDMSKGSMHGLLKTLENSGAIEQSEERLYTLGPRIYNLAQAYTQRAGLRHFALPAMQRLAANIGETIFLGRVEQERVQIIEYVEAEKEHPHLHISARRGTRIHLLAGATGRVVLASWSIQEQEAFLHTHLLPRFTEHSITDTKLFLQEVEKTRHTGIGIDHEEYLTGVNAVAAPINSVGGACIALLWIVGFASRFGDTLLENAAQQLHMEATMISRALGAKL